jgi:hypothetical protein
MDNLCNYKNYLVNGTFDLDPKIPSNTFKYYSGNTVKGWTFNNGVIINNSKDWGYPTPYPCGNQACSIQMTKSISQTFNVPKAGTYSLLISYVGRPRYGGNTLHILLNEKQIKSIQNPSTDKWNTMVIELNLTSPINNKLDIVGTATSDLSTAIQLILTDPIQSKLPSAILKPNEKLTVGQYKYSDNREYFMTLKADGNLCVYNDKEEQIWCSGKSGPSNPFTIFQTDGNLVIYQPVAPNVVWASGTNGPNRTQVSLDNDGIIRIWDNLNNIVWSSTNNYKSPSPKIIPNVPSPQPKNVDFNYNVSSASVYVLGNYGIAPWGTNTKFIDNTAQWIWYSQEANKDAPNNSNSPMTIQYVYSNKSGIEIDANLNVIIDNSCEVFLNSQPVKRNNGQLTAAAGWGQGDNAWNIFPCKIQPGENLFEFKVKNAGGPGGLLVSATTVGAGPDNNKVLFHTNGEWKFVPITTKPIVSCNLSQPGLISTIDKSFPWGCLTLNGTQSQYVNIDKTITGMGGISFGCWFRSNSNKDMTKIIDFGNGQNNNIFLYIKNNKLGATVLLTNKNTNKQSDNLSSPINDNKWHHIVWTIQPISTGANYKIYLNNNMISTIQGAYPINMERTNCFLGKSNWSNNPYFSGAISNFVMYQKVLSEKEINNLYMSMINLNDPALYIYLPFSTNSVLDTLLNNYAGKTFSLPITKSKVESENWTCIEEEKNKWIGVKMENGKAICMSMNGTNCIEEESEKACASRISNPIVPSNPIICGTSQMNLSWCDIAQKQLTQPATAKTQGTSGAVNKNVGDTSIDNVKPGVKALSALESNVGEKSLNLKDKQSGGQILSLKNMSDVDNLMVGGTFKLRVNLPMMPPYIKGKTFDINKGVNPNYFYLCVEKLDNNCNIKGANGKCTQTFADDKKCNIKSLTSYTHSNTYRLVLVSSQYVLDPSVPIGKNSDFTLVQVNKQLYLKNIQTGYLPSLYSNEMVFPIYGDMEVKSNSNVNKIYTQLYNTNCSQEIPQIQTQGTTFVKCDIKQDPGTYLITTKNVGSSSPVRVNINSDKSISLNLLSFNTYGYPTKVYAITSCNFNVQTYAYIEKMTNALGTFMVNMVCFEDTQNNKANPKNQLKFTVELINFPKDFVKDNSIFDVN